MPPHPPIIFGHPSGGTSSEDCNQLLQDIARYQSLVDFLNRSLASTNGPLARQQIQNELDTAQRVLEDTQANYQRNCVRAPLPPPKFQAAPWSFATPFGIHLSNGQWHTGSVNAVLPISRNRLLIATEQGGLWMGEHDAEGLPTTRCLSDSWPHYQFTCFAVDPANPDRVFAGCVEGGGGGVYVGNVGVSFDDWFFVPMPLALGDWNDVAAMIVLPGQRLLVAATGGGVAWTGIDDATFAWRSDLQPVQRLANLEGDAFLYIASDPRPLALASATLNTGQISGGAFSGTPVPAGAIQWVRHSNPSNITPIQIATCRDYPGNAYCLGTLDDATGSGLLFIIRLQAGSAAWTECSYTTNQAPVDLGELLDIPLAPSEVGTPKSDKNITVHPSNPLLVAAGFKGGAFSRDGGATWIALSDLKGWHSDVHAMLFDEPSDSLYIPCDGGILRRPDMSRPDITPENYDTSWNQTLPVVMLYSPGGLRMQFGNLALGAGIVAAGSQDNADLWWDPAAPEWRKAGGGDGGVVAIHQDGADTYLVNGETLPTSTSWSRRQGDRMSGGKVLQLCLNWAAVDGAGVNPVYARAVPPQVGMAIGPKSSPVIALASSKGSNLIYGAVFHDSFGWPFGTMTVTDPPIEWTALSAIPAGEVVSALEPFDAVSVLAGTDSGRLFRAQLGGGYTELTFDTKPTLPIKGIASDGTIIACFTVSPTTPFAHSHTGLLYVGRIGSGLTLLNTTLCPLNDGNSVFYAIAANRNSNFLRFSFALVANDHEVWVSNSPLAVLWQKWVQNLPAAVLGSDLVFSESATEGELWLSTYGRGLWRLPF